MKEKLLQIARDDENPRKFPRFQIKWLCVIQPVYIDS